MNSPSSSRRVCALNRKASAPSRRHHPPQNNPARSPPPIAQYCKRPYDFPSRLESARKKDEDRPSYTSSSRESRPGGYSHATLPLAYKVNEFHESRSHNEIFELAEPDYRRPLRILSNSESGRRYWIGTSLQCEQIPMQHFSKTQCISFPYCSSNSYLLLTHYCRLLVRFPSLMYSYDFLPSAAVRLSRSNTSAAGVAMPP